ncbi:MAG: PD-(D/E)XK nuclease family protein, partial [Endomicrobiia bacterium]
IKDGLYYIIDYKTGKVPEKKEYMIGDEFTEFQLPLYALMFSRECKNKIGGLIYYKIGREITTKVICDECQASNYIEEFKEKILIPTISEMINKNIPFYQTKDKTFCKYCLYRVHCGVK